MSQFDLENERAQKRARMARLLGGAAVPAGTAVGTGLGAAVGTSLVPGLGTAGGAAIGGALGGGAGTLAQLASEFFANEQTRGFDQAEQRRRERLELLSRHLGRFA